MWKMMDPSKTKLIFINTLKKIQLAPNKFIQNYKELPYGSLLPFSFGKLLSSVPHVIVSNVEVTRYYLIQIISIPLNFFMHNFTPPLKQIVWPQQNTQISSIREKICMRYRQKVYQNNVPTWQYPHYYVMHLPPSCLLLLCLFLLPSCLHFFCVLNCSLIFPASDCLVLFCSLFSIPVS